MTPSTPVPKQPRRVGRTAPLEVVRLHPLMRRHLASSDLRRIEILRVEESLAVDVIVRNRPVSSR